MRQVGGCCGTDWHLISSDQHVFFLVFWLLLPLALRCCFQSRGFLQLLVRGSGILTDDWAMILVATIRVLGVAAMWAKLSVSWLVSVSVLHKSTISFPCILGLYFLLSLALFLQFERLARSPFPCWDLW